MSESLAELLSASNIREYSARPMPSEMDEVIGKFVQYSLVEYSQGRDIPISELGTPRNIWWLSLYAQRMAAMAVRFRDPRLAIDGLNALAIASHGDIDSRDLALIVSLAHHSLVLLNVDVHALFKTDVEATSWLQAVIDGFPNRDAFSRSIEAMDFMEDHSPDGFRYKRIPR